MILVYFWRNLKVIIALVFSALIIFKWFSQSFQAPGPWLNATNAFSVCLHANEEINLCQ